MLTASIASQVAQAIVNHQKAIIGPLAYEQAKKVPGFIIAQDSVSINPSESNPSSAIENLVQKYADLFGQTSIEVCRDAVRELGSSISTKDLPTILQ